MKERKYISRNEAAELCGVCPQTITNWCEGGLVRYVDRLAKKRRVRLYLREDVEAMVPVAEEIEEKTIEVEEYIRALDEEKERAVAELEQVRKEQEDKVGSTKAFDTAGEVCMTILNSYYGNDSLAVRCLTPREMVILEFTMKLKPIWEISEVMDISPERIRQIRTKALWKVTSPENAVDIHSIIASSNELKSQLEKTRASLAMAEDRLAEYGLNQVGGGENGGMRAKLSTKLSDLGISVRLFNCMKMADIETIADVTSWPRIELMKIRCFGRKTLYELENLLEKMGLEFGMEVERYGFVNCYKTQRRSWR